MNVGDRITTKRKGGSEWLIVGQKAGMLRVRNLDDGLRALLDPVEAARSYRVVSGRPGFEGLVERHGDLLVRVDAGRACRVKTERVN